MKEFPNSLQYKNRASFPNLNYDRVKAYLRRDIYEHIISSKPEDYFDVNKFKKTHNISMEKAIKMAKEITSELTELGWNTELTHGDTGLYIYGEEKPKALLLFGDTIEPA
jgi:DUF2075 family protein